MDTTGTRQVWTVDGPGEWPEQRTFFDDSVSFAIWSPTRQELAFGMDSGGDERQQFYLLDAETGDISGLTECPDAKHLWGGWSHDGDRMAFAANRRDSSVFDVYIQSRDVDDAELVFEADGGLLYPRGWGPDDRRLLLKEVHSNHDADLYVLDVESGERRHVTPHDGEVRYGTVQWAPEGDAAYVVTDEGDDVPYLARIDFDGEVNSVLRDEWPVTGARVDVETGRFVARRNIDGYTDVTVGEFEPGSADYQEFPDPDLPPGVCSGATFGPDADRFEITVTADALNKNVYVVDVETGAVEQWTRAPTAGIPTESFQSSNLVRVSSFDGLEVPGFLTLPAEWEAGETPALVSVHGGPESQRRPSFSRVKQFFVQRGYAFFEPNVRGSTGYGSDYESLDDVERRMDAVADVAECAEWLGSHKAVDADRLAVMGGSYGGFIVLANLIEYPDLWAAGVDIVGIANFVTFLENTAEWRRSAREAEYGSLDEDRDFLESISPVNRADEIGAPLFVIHGENDPRVPVGETEQIAAAAEEAGVDVEKLVFEDEGHGISKEENRVEAYTQIAEFLADHV